MIDATDPILKVLCPCPLGIRHALCAFYYCVTGHTSISSGSWNQSLHLLEINAGIMQ